MEESDDLVGLDNDYQRLRKISSLKRENRRLRNSPSFQLGVHLTD